MAALRPEMENLRSPNAANKHETELAELRAELKAAKTNKADENEVRRVELERLRGERADAENKIMSPLIAELEVLREKQIKTYSQFKVKCESCGNNRN